MDRPAQIGRSIDDREPVYGHAVSATVELERASVLLEIDELSYKTSEENPVVVPRPIAWYREFDGGRTFYTALGHTVESYADPLFLDHVWGGLMWVLSQ